MVRNVINHFRHERAFWGNVGQWGALLVLAFGLGFQVARGANQGHIGITVGAAVFALATKWKHERRA